MRIAKDKGVWSGVETAGIGRKVADVRTPHKPFSVGGALTAAQGPRECCLLRSVGRKIPRLSGHPPPDTKLWG
jgi:hypothetical protein